MGNWPDFLCLKWWGISPFALQKDPSSSFWSFSSLSLAVLRQLEVFGQVSPGLGLKVHACEGKRPLGYPLPFHLQPSRAHPGQFCTCSRLGWGPFLTLSYLASFGPLHFSFVSMGPATNWIYGQNRFQHVQVVSAPPPFSDPGVWFSLLQGMPQQEVPCYLLQSSPWWEAPEESVALFEVQSSFSSAGHPDSNRTRSPGSISLGGMPLWELQPVFPIMGQILYFFRLTL